MVTIAPHVQILRERVAKRLDVRGCDLPSDKMEILMNNDDIRLIERLCLFAGLYFLIGSLLFRLAYRLNPPM